MFHHIRNEENPSIELNCECRRSSSLERNRQIAKLKLKFNYMCVSNRPENLHNTLKQWLPTDWKHFCVCSIGSTVLFDLPLHLCQSPRSQISLAIREATRKQFCVLRPNRWKVILCPHFVFLSLSLSSFGDFDFVLQLWHYVAAEIMRETTFQLIVPDI